MGGIVWASLLHVFSDPGSHRKGEPLQAASRRMNTLLTSVLPPASCPMCRTCSWQSLRRLEARWSSCCLTRDLKSILRPVRTASHFESAEVPHLVTAKHKSVVSQDLSWLLLSAFSKRLPGKKFFWGFWGHAKDSVDLEGGQPQERLQDWPLLFPLWAPT